MQDVVLSAYVCIMDESLTYAQLLWNTLQEIAWHPLDHLQPASNEVITHGVAGLKLYMVAPFLG